jgi:hypothetical protein
VSYNSTYIRSNSLLTMFSLQITAQSMCIEINMNRVALVARHQPVPVKLSEYYEPSMLITFRTLTSNSSYNMKQLMY